ncbi:MAG: GNAT family N-acetyltransferase [Proteobacteria bacterium]|nr:GNAT family N-acetyltransferase [Pseudomonadota bacterium]
MSAAIVSPMVAADHAEWLPLWRSYQAFYRVDLAQAVTEATWARLLDPAEPVDGAIARVGGEALGLVHVVRHRSTWSVADKCYLNDLFVTPAARGQGVGRSLIEYVYATATRAGCGAVYWLTHESNETAMRLYDRIGRRSGFVQYNGAFP